MSVYGEIASEPRALRWLGQVIDLTTVVSGTLIVILMFGNVLSRFIFNYDVAWSTEMIGFLMIWATFLGGAAAARRGVHMRIAEFIAIAAGRTRRNLELAINASVATVLALLTYHGWSIAMGNMDQLSTVLYLPVGLQYAALPVGSALAMVYVAHDSCRLLGWGVAAGSDA